MEFKGIDVSKYQGNIDWKTVKNSGIQFAMIRLGLTGWGDGKTKRKDEMFDTNYTKAKEVGMSIGAYYYSCAENVTEAKKEAELTIEWLKGKQLEYPIAYDVEENKKLGEQSKQTITDIVKAYCSTLQNAGYYVTIYASKNWLDNKMDYAQLVAYDKWVAQWTPKCTFNGTYGMWQYTSDGSVSGINGRVDMDVAYKDYATIIKNAHLNGFAEEVKPSVKPVTPQPTPTTSGYEVGDIVNFKGGKVYKSASALFLSATKTASKCKITIISKGNKHEYHCISQDSKGVYGWVDGADIGTKTITSSSVSIKVGDTVKIKSGAKDYAGGKLATFVYSRSYKIKELSGNRAVLTFNGVVVAAINTKDLIK